MVRLAGLMQGVSEALQVPESRVRTAAAELRKHKLVQTGPRGPGAPNMKAGDAAALLLAIMYDDELAVAAESVTRLGAASLRYARATRRGDLATEEPPHSLFRTASGEMAELGEVVRTILAHMVLGNLWPEEIGDDEHLEVFNLTLAVEAPGYLADIRFNNFDAFWHLRYQWKSPEQLAYESKKGTGTDMRPRWDALKGPYMSSSRSVGEDALWLIADCLRDGPLSVEGVEACEQVAQEPAV